MKKESKTELSTLFETHKKSILTTILAILCVVGAICAIYFPNSNINNIISETESIIIEEIKVSEETEKLVENTKIAIDNNEDLSTTETVKSFDEEILETDAVVDQENISYDGDNLGKGLNLLGPYQGLIYYSQADSRWANVMYSSTNNSSQTMKSSACGPTSAAMVVSSSKGTILPTTLAQLSMDNGFRTANSGTAWAFYSFVADYFDFNEYYTTSDFDTAMKYLKADADKDGNADYYIICSCGSGLFTTNGHYIVLVADKNGTITVYDPYLYNEKFSTTSRKKANVTVSGNSVYVTETNFEKYANYKNFWVYSNDKGEGNPNTVKNTENKKTTTTKTKTYTRYVKVNSSLNVRKSNSTESDIVDKLKKGTKVTVYEVKGNWSKIGTNKWVYSEYLTTNKPKSSTIKNTVGKTKVLSKATTLYSKSNLSGTKYNYKKNTTVKILKNISSTIDYVQVKTTGRKAYIKNNVYK